MRSPWFVLSISLFSIAAYAETPLDAHWDPGAVDCTQAKHPPLETYRFGERTWIIREDLCSTWEAPFIYLLVGDREALLIDTGDVADPKLMPLASTVLGLLSQQH